MTLYYVIGVIVALALSFGIGKGLSLLLGREQKHWLWYVFWGGLLALMVLQKSWLGILVILILMLIML
jgi:hypothetical protein